MSNNNQIILEEIINQQMKSLEITSDINKFFEIFSALQILKNHELSYEEIEQGNVDGSLDGAIDSIYFFINGELINWLDFELDKTCEDSDIDIINQRFIKNIQIEVIIIQSKFEKSFKETPISKIKTTFENLLELEQHKTFINRYNNKVIKAFDVFRAIYLKLVIKRCDVKFKLFYTTKGENPHQNVREQATELEELIRLKLPNASANVELIGAKELIELFQRQSNQIHELDFVDQPIFGGNSSYIGLVDLECFYNFMLDENNELNKQIFESNVRDYQGQNSVNNEIELTLKNGTEDFWWLNNGVTVLGTNLIHKSNRKLAIENPEIVNGLQTSYEIYRFFSSGVSQKQDVTSSRRLLVRLIVPGEDYIRDKIIKATNSQTQIPKASLRSTDPIHRSIEIYLKQHDYYYDRRKNYYKNMGKKPKQIVSIPFLSQALMSVLLQKPDYARARPSTLLDDEASYDQLFSDKIPLDVFYKLVHLAKFVEEKCRAIDGLESSQGSDIKFHILYTMISLSVKNSKPTDAHINKLEIEQAIDKITIAIEITKELFIRFGANNKIAKSPEFRNELISKLNECY